jgi:cytochrome P450
MEQFVRGVVQRVVAERLTDGRADLVAALTYELPASVLFHIMGVPLEDLGAPLARLEARVVLEELASAVPSLRLLPDQTYEFMPIIAFRGPRSLHVSWDRCG